MNEKSRTTLYISSETLNEAKDLGLNISKTCENCLKQAIRQLRPLYDKNNPRDYSENAENKRLVGLPGFEPGSRAPEACARACSIETL